MNSMEKMSGLNRFNGRVRSLKILSDESIPEIDNTFTSNRKMLYHVSRQLCQ
jgi:hypothetical protein